MSVIESSSSLATSDIPETTSQEASVDVTLSTVHSSTAMYTINVAETPTQVKTPSSTNLQSTSSSISTQSSPVATILAVVFGISSLFLLLVSTIGLLLIWLYVRKPKQKESSGVLINEQPKVLDVIYEDPDAFAFNTQLKVSGYTDLPTIENVAYSTKLQILQEKKEDTLVTAENIVNSTKSQVYENEEQDTEYYI